MNVGDLLTLVNSKKEKIKIEERFDLRCYDNILKSIKGNTTILQKIINHYNSEFNKVQNYSINDMKRDLSKLILYFKKEQTNYQEDVETDKGMIEVGFFYDVIGNKKRESKKSGEAHELRVEYNLYSSYSKEAYFNELKNYIIGDLTTKIQSSLNIKVLLIQMASKKDIYIHNSKSKKIETHNKTIIDKLVEYIKTNKQFNFISNQSIIPQWLNIEYNINNIVFKSLFEKVKTEFQDVEFNENKERFRFLLFVLNIYHSHINLYEELKIVKEIQTVEQLFEFSVYYTTKHDETQKEERKTIFDPSTRITKSATETYMYQVSNLKFLIVKNDPSFLRFHAKNDMKSHVISIKRYDNIKKNIDLIAKLKPVKLNQGISYHVEIYNKKNPKSGILAKGLLEEVEIKKEDKMISTNRSLYTSNLYLKSDKRIKNSNTFYGIKNFDITTNIIKEYQTYLDNTEDIYFFIIELFSNKAKLNDFYLFCTTHDDQNISSKTKEKLSEKSIIQNQLKLMFEQNRPFYLDVSKFNTSQAGTYVQYVIGNYSETSIINNIATVVIYLISKKKKLKIETNAKNTNTPEQNALTFKDSCKKKKQGLLNMTKKWLNSSMDTLRIWKIKTIGGTKKKYRKKKKKQHKKKRRTIKRIY